MARLRKDFIRAARKPRLIFRARSPDNCHSQKTFVSWRYESSIDRSGLYLESYGDHRDCVFLRAWLRCLLACDAQMTSAEFRRMKSRLLVRLLVRTAILRMRMAIFLWLDLTVIRCVLKDFADIHSP